MPSRWRPVRSYACKHTWRHVHLTALGSFTPGPAPAALAAIPLAIPLIPPTAVAATSSFQPVYSGTLAPTPPPPPHHHLWGSALRRKRRPQAKSRPTQGGKQHCADPSKTGEAHSGTEFVDMRELLPDNIALAERLAALPPGLATPKPPGEREIRG